jgi:hypothetical protein
MRGGIFANFATGFQSKRCSRSKAVGRGAARGSFANFAKGVQSKVVRAAGRPAWRGVFLQILHAGFRVKSLVVQVAVRGVAEFRKEEEGLAEGRGYSGRGSGFEGRLREICARGWRCGGGGATVRRRTGAVRVGLGPSDVYLHWAEDIRASALAQSREPRFSKISDSGNQPCAGGRCPGSRAPGVSQPDFTGMGSHRASRALLALPREIATGPRQPHPQAQ